MRNILHGMLFLLMFAPWTMWAQGDADPQTQTFKVKILEVLHIKKEILPPDNIVHTTQTLRGTITSGEQKGEEIVFDNDFVELEAGDTVFLDRTTSGEFEYYTVKDMDRTVPLLILFGLFFGTVILFGGFQGARSVLTLFASLLAIIYILIPALLAGYSPVLMSVIVGTVILFFAIFFVHGWNKPSFIAFMGTVISVAATGILAAIFVHMSSLTGFFSDEATYLHVYTGGSINIAGILLAAIIIGSLGVLDDIAMTQVAVVKEFFDLDEALSERQVYKKALIVGRAHIGTLINTLVLAYAGVTLPLLLLFFYNADTSFVSMINKEVFATEIVRSLVGSIGLILAVPITTRLAVIFLKRSIQ
jgi:uncharacterized membrane protein